MWVQGNVRVHGQQKVKEAHSSGFGEFIILAGIKLSDGAVLWGEQPTSLSYEYSLDHVPLGPIKYLFTNPDLGEIVPLVCWLPCVE